MLKKKGAPKMSNFEENKQSIVEIDSSIYAKNDSGVAKKLKYLGFPSTEHLHRINFYLRSNGYLRFFLSGNFNDLVKFEKVFKEIVPYLCEHELFHAYVPPMPYFSRILAHVSFFIRFFT